MVIALLLEIADRVLSISLSTPACPEVAEYLGIRSRNSLSEQR